MRALVICLTDERRENRKDKGEKVPRHHNLNCLLGLCLYVFVSLVFLSSSFFVFLVLSRHHYNQMSELSQGSEVTLSSKVLKWQSVTKGRYRAVWGQLKMLVQPAR